MLNLTYLKLYISSLYVSVFAFCIFAVLKTDFIGQQRFRTSETRYQETRYGRFKDSLFLAGVSENVTEKTVLVHKGSTAIPAVKTPEYNSSLLMTSDTEKYLDTNSYRPCQSGIKDCRKRLPQAIVIGAKKCGTGTLRYFLRVHPQVAFSKHVEIHYFDVPWKYKNGINWYRNQMSPSWPDQITIEKTPRYFVCGRAPTAIHDDISPKTKIIILIRDPVKRAVSDYLAVKHMEGITKITFENITVKSSHLTPPYTDPIYYIRSSFEESVLDSNGSINIWNGLINIGLYANHIRRWLQVFPKEQILVLDSDEFVQNPLKTLTLVEQFLKLTPFFRKKHFYLSPKKGFYCLRMSGKVSCQGSSKGRKHPTVDQSVIEKLKEFYKPFNKELVELLNQNFSWVV